EGVDDLVRAGLVLEEREGLVLRHALLGEAALAELAPRRTRRLHSALAARLESPGEAARHHLVAGELGAGYAKARVAAEAAKTPGERARHLAVAARCARGADAAAVRLEAAEALVASGAFAEAEAILDTFESDDREALAEAHLHRAGARLGLSDSEGFERELDRGLALVRGTSTPVEARLALARVEVAIWSWDVENADRFAREAWRLAEATGTDRAKARLRLAQALCLAQLPAEAAEHAAEARLLAQEAEDVATALEAATALGAALEMTGDILAAREVAQGAVELAASLGLRGAELFARTQELHLRFEADGPSRSIAAALEELLTEPLGALRSTAIADLAAALAELGDPDKARALIQENLPTVHVFGRATLEGVLADVEWLDGRPEDALAATERATSPAIDYWIAVVRAWALTDLGRADEIAEPPASSWRYPGAPETVHALRALTANQFSLAEGLFLEAAGRWFERRHALRCRWGAAEAARRAKDLRRAQAHLLPLEAEVADLEMRLLLGRIRKSLRAAGVRRAGSRKGSSLLSGREREILVLVAEGQSSREIAARLSLAQRTVDSQIRSAMLKLGARTRLEAAARAAQETARARGDQGDSSVPVVPVAIVEDAGTAEHVTFRLQEEGWNRVAQLDPGKRPWDVSAERLVVVTSVRTRADAGRVLLAASRGVSLVVVNEARRSVAAQLVEDLQRLGTTVTFPHRRADPLRRLEPEEHRLLTLVASGSSIADAAHKLHIARRTADRRLAAARRTLGVKTTSEAVMVVAAAASKSLSL
ncbi:MAG: helix-turn-helix transcriptional regulator, partial [Actinomycetota bacterium]|nr:helix-turn-helix transcriptional regulator [Actinomycetota bacterium]